MMDFEDQLREALRLPDVPAGFTNRVLAKLPEAYPPAPRHPVMRRVAVWTAVMVVVAGGITGLQIERAQEQRERGEKAREEVMLALRITGTKLNQAQSHVRQVSDDGSTNGERP
jgi:hypothetical protein